MEARTYSTLSTFLSLDGRKGAPMFCRLAQLFRAYPIMDENGIRFSFLSDIDQAGRNLEVGSKDRSNEEGRGNERANEPSGDHVFLGHGVGARVVPHCAFDPIEQTNPPRSRSK